MLRNKCLVVVEVVTVLSIHIHICANMPVRDANGASGYSIPVVMGCIMTIVNGVKEAHVPHLYQLDVLEVPHL